MEPLTDRHYFVILRGWSSRQHEYSPPKHSHNSNTAPEHAPSFEGWKVVDCVGDFGGGMWTAERSGGGRWIGEFGIGLVRVCVSVGSWRVLCGALLVKCSLRW